MSEFDPEKSPLSELDDEIARRTGWIIDQNAEVMNTSREMARALIDLAEQYRELADECDEIAKMQAIAARRVADINGDIISNEWGITVVDSEDEGSSDE